MAGLIRTTHNIDNRENKYDRLSGYHGHNIDYGENGFGC